MPERNNYNAIYLRAAGAVAYVSVVDAKGDAGIGTAFHIGSGIFVTARHVVEGVQIMEVATTKSTFVDETQSLVVRPRLLKIIDGPHYGDDTLDAAIFRVDLEGEPLAAIKLSAETGYELEENNYILSNVLVIGYPPIPFTNIPYQVVTLAQINAMIRVRHSPNIHFIASAMARGGFSGGVALIEDGTALALVTESLGTGSSLVETGYMSLLFIEPVVDLAGEKYKFSVHGSGIGRYTDTLIGIKFSKPTTMTLNSFIPDAFVFVYDDDRDVFIEIGCDDEAVLRDAVDAFQAVTPVLFHRIEPDTGAWFLTPRDNPSSVVLVRAAEAVRELLFSRGYLETAVERGSWQIEGKTSG